MNNYDSVMNYICETRGLLTAMGSMIEAHFCGIASQSSIYGLTSLFTGESSHKVLVASSRRKVYCIEYSKNINSVIFSTRVVQFTYIPEGAEIISIDAFNQACHVHDFVVGITFTKSDNGGKQSQYFNIYSDWEPSNECDLDSIAQGCLSICLDFIPFHLTHTELIMDETKEMVWLLSGSDCKIHLYREDKTRQTYCEEPSDICFPEFKDLTSVVLWMDFIMSSDSRLTAIGYKDGLVSVTLVKLIPEIKIVSSWQIQHDSPISMVRLFQDSDLLNLQQVSFYHPLLCHFLNTNIRGNGVPLLEHMPNILISDPNMDILINLLVGNTLEVCVVYRNILSNGLDLTSQFSLPDSDKFDCVTCGHISDIDMDGKNEILLGTYGQQLLIYKWEKQEDGNYRLFHQQMFPNPLLAMSYIDITGDGLKELLILSTKGLHILQHDLKTARDICLRRMKYLAKNVSREDLEILMDNFLR